MMQISTVSASTSEPSHTEKARRHKDGSVLLSIADDRLCKLNGVGALTWMVLEENQSRLTVDDVVWRLGEKFDAINAEGQLRYEVSREQLRADTSRFLKTIAQMNLLGIETDARGEEVYVIKEGVSSTTSNTVATAAKHRDIASPPEPIPTSRGSIEGDIRLLKRETFTAFMGLLAFDLLLKFAGFQAVVKRVKHWPTSKPHTTDLELCRRVRAMVDRAQMYYPKKAMCLQHSAVVTCLLRRRGVPAEMVLAAQEFPPKAHAWSEVSGEVVNDSHRVKTKFLELRRV
jgi:Transglutaminase-like superfamily